MMKILTLSLSIIFFLMNSGCESGSETVMLKMETELGEITIEIYLDKAPITALNFLKYVDDGVFKNSKFYRVVRDDNQPDNDVTIDVIQGGLSTEEEMYPPIEHETTLKTGIRHKDGAISMARLEPGTATSEFFICVGDQPELDFGGHRNPDGQGFAAFGKVVEGMEVVRKIHQQPVDGQILNPEILIVNLTRLERAGTQIRSKYY